MNEFDTLVAERRSRLRAARQPPAELENAKARFLGKSGELTELLKGLGRLPADEKQARGAAHQRRQGAHRGGARGAPRRAGRRPSCEAQLADEALDVTLPGRGRGSGGLHPMMRTWQRIEAIFRSMGFDVADGPEIETDWYNFTALNNPENHPARSMQDTFYVDVKDAEGRWLNLRAAHQPDAGALCARARRAAAGAAACPRSA